MLYGSTHMPTAGVKGLVYVLMLNNFAASDSDG